tara:strand:- start:34 stop:207 length:174 start_codon:yes stop_codon:yes gene_type:complete
MIIKNAKYKKDLLGNIIIVEAIIDDKTLYVPLDSNNRHYIAILEWVKEDGNTIQEAD